MYKMFARKLFGVKMEKVKKALFIWLIMFWGLYLADLDIQIAPLILYLMVSTVTVGVMWQALSSEENVENMKNMFMMPFAEKHFIFSYVSALGIYTLLTKTMGLMAVALAVSAWGGTEIWGCILCTVNAILMTACTYAARKYRGLCIVWGGAIATSIFRLWNSTVFLPMLVGNGLMAGVILAHVDAYAFYLWGGKGNRVVKSSKRPSVWRYLFRYLIAHKNYLMNTAVMWLVACVLPVFLGQIEGVFVMPIGFAILSLNTPICILLSCDPDLERAVRFLPGQKTAFCVPYCIFIFLCNMAGNLIFLGSWYLINGEFQANGMNSMSVYVILTAVFFAMQSAVGSVLMEWFYPIRGWKIESDLWHHPRKYIVPAVMLLLAGAVGTIPKVVPVLTIVLMIEAAILLIQCRRC